LNVKLVGASRKKQALKGYTIKKGRKKKKRWITVHYSIEQTRQIGNKRYGIMMGKTQTAF
jgi:hypothetical protein